MSTPEHKPATTEPNDHIGHAAASAELQARQDPDTALYARVTTPTRTTRVISWLGWHVGELSGITGPVVFGAAVSSWFYLASGLAALGWAGNELRLRRQQHNASARATSAGDGEVK
ncbi:hypothetical protein LWP59_27535 [Amycolatopsis acidiphila]|uniref:Uncharacterized protein n=2 Tax=Amycolatopsis acidiphila TaxID=715473 RepID=A0A558A125_9PSEU|nr:hypothetical protein [Amycolatopsis acidiphila]TVT17968.1 hypothetical protein FNH06_29545 [Amycolatopsis acidiphila]UIJ57869.1 hypothetical protein LWP59_27535 [Amycolatopsis acidiphila]GHG71299.1 hypothetical protein GCM10017788_33120 [Amycolatopsis acidiphila]